MAEQPAELAGLIVDKIEQLEEAERGEWMLLLGSLLGLLSERNDSTSKASEVRRVRKYVGKLKDPARVGKSRLPSERLLEMARATGHSKWRFSSEELRRMQGHVWRSLINNAEVWPAEDLVNLLSYALRQRLPEVGTRHSTSKEVAQHFYEVFRHMPARTRDSAFLELLQRVLSEPAFRKALAEAGALQ